MGVEKPILQTWLQYWGPNQDVSGLPPGYTDERGHHPGLIIEAGFDPAISEKDTAARSALVVAGQVRHPSMRGRLLILEAIAGHWSVWEQCRQILNAVTRWKIRTVRVEDVAYQKALKDILAREARTRGLHVHIELIKPDGDKLRRANAWSPLVEDGTVLFPTTGSEDPVASMLAVPGDPSKWDLVDAAGHCLRGFPALEAARTRLHGANRVDAGARRELCPAWPRDATERRRHLGEIRGTARRISGAERKATRGSGPARCPPRPRSCSSTGPACAAQQPAPRPAASRWVLEIEIYLSARTVSE